MNEILGMLSVIIPLSFSMTKVLSLKLSVADVVMVSRSGSL